ncbi:hypothetical protein SynBIOSE41_03691 [Synechococcus sp. BIOS-E4-1]|nr:hypothetical protein SynBIOSE41_03691 [Synechococcus sp. BIOS-E4-1]
MHEHEVSSLHPDKWWTVIAFWHGSPALLIRTSHPDIA